jgi:hypothetical protein
MEGKMKKTLVLVLLLLLVFSVVTFVNAAEITGSAKANILGKYLWRGSVLYDGLTIQPELKIVLNKFEITYWASYDGSVEDDYKLEESDLWVSFEDGLPFAEIVMLNAGFVSYMYHYEEPGQRFSVEVFAGLSLDTLLEPYFTFYYDAMLGNGGYLELGVSHSMEIGPVEANGSLSTGYNFSQYKEDFDSFSPSFTAILFNLGFTYDIAAFGVEITPSFIGQLAMTDQYENAATWSVAINYDFTLGGGKEKKEE